MKQADRYRKAENSVLSIRAEQGDKVTKKKKKSAMKMNKLSPVK